MESNVISNMAEPSDISATESISSYSSSSLWKYIIIFLILAFLGFNLFTYLGKTSKFFGSVIDNILELFRPIITYFGYGISKTAKKTVDLTAVGTKKAVDITAGTLTGGINVLERGLAKDTHKKDKQKDIVMPDEAGSLTQASKANRKAGFCYIGEDRGFRSCISVGEGDTCMSGDIFPSMDMCINPSLRSG
jgi:hypothetical protein